MKKRKCSITRFFIKKEIAQEGKHVILNRFSLEKETDCWNWMGFIDYNGYGKVTFHRINMGAHRLSYMIFNGEIEEGFDVCHRCDNRKCVNPSHLFLGTRKDNAQDCVSKGRQAKGFSLPHTKLSINDIEIILNFAKTGEKYRDIANKFNVHPTYISWIARKNGIYRKQLKLPTSLEVNNGIHQ